MQVATDLQRMHTGALCSIVRVCAAKKKQYADVYSVIRKFSIMQMQKVYLLP